MEKTEITHPTVHLPCFLPSASSSPQISTPNASLIYGGGTLLWHFHLIFMRPNFGGSSSLSQPTHRHGLCSDPHEPTHSQMSEAGLQHSLASAGTTYLMPEATQLLRPKTCSPGGPSSFLATIKTCTHSPPPRMRVASCHCRTYFRHLPTPSGVMLKEHMGSPAMVSAPNCSTTASGLKAAYTSFSTLQREAEGYHQLSSVGASNYTCTRAALSRRAGSQAWGHSFPVTEQSKVCSCCFSQAQDRRNRGGSTLSLCPLPSPWSKNTPPLALTHCTQRAVSFPFFITSILLQKATGTLLKEILGPKRTTPFPALHSKAQNITKKNMFLSQQCLYSSKIRKRCGSWDKCFCLG